MDEFLAALKAHYDREFFDDKRSSVASQLGYITAILKQVVHNHPEALPYLANHTKELERLG